MKSKSWGFLPILATGCLLFQIVMDCLGSVVAFPFMHFAMYSEIVRKRETYERYSIVVDGEKLDVRDFRIQHWDHIIAPLGAYEDTRNPLFYSKEIHYLQLGFRELGLVEFAATIPERISNRNYDQATFSRYFKTYLKVVLHREIHHLQVYKEIYSYEGGQFRFLKKVQLV